MDNYQRCKIRLYQYLMARGDSLKLKAEESIDNIRMKKHPSEADIRKAAQCVHDWEFFEVIYSEILEYI